NWGDGKQTRSFQWIDDCVKGTQMIMNGDYAEPLNLGSSELVTINQLVDFAEDIAGLKLKRRYNLSAPKGVNGRNSDNTLIRKIYNWEPSTRLRDGLERTYRSIHDQMISAKTLQSVSQFTATGTGRLKAKTRKPEMPKTETIVRLKR